MTDITKALDALGITGWSLIGEPTSEEEFNSSFTKHMGSTDDGDLITSTNPSDFGVTWAEVYAKKQELIAAEPMRLLRKERDKRLAESDWMALPDRTMTAEQTAYRQALRDVPQNYTSLEDVVWPTKP